MPRLFVFDVDSTLLQVESLDLVIEAVLARDNGDGTRRRRLAEITDLGMAGEMDFRQSLEARLELAELKRFEVEAAAKEIVDQATPGIKPLLDKLRTRGHQVYAVSGGFVDLVEPALKSLDFALGEIRANRFTYDDDTVTGFDRNNPLSRSGGKGPVVSALKIQTGCQPAIMIGDGITDYEAFAEGGADAFIGFGGVRRREAVAEKAPVFADDVAALEAMLLG